MLKKLILFSLSLELFIMCSNKKEYCYSQLKKGPDIQGIDSAGSCATHIILENQIKDKMNRGENITRDKIISDSFLILCLEKNIQERKCSKESEYLPHFGY